MTNKMLNITCIGCGTIGAGWVARLLQNNFDVKIYDPTPLENSRLDSILSNSKRAYRKLFPNSKRVFGSFNYYSEIELLLPLAIAVFIGTNVGKKMLGVIPEKLFRIMFKTALTLIAIKLIADQWQPFYTFFTNASCTCKFNIISL